MVLSPPVAVPVLGAGAALLVGVVIFAVAVRIGSGRVVGKLVNDLAELRLKSR